MEIRVLAGIQSLLAGGREIEPDPGQHRMAKGLQVGRGIGQRFFRHTRGPCGIGCGEQPVQRAIERGRVFAQAFDGSSALDRIGHTRCQQFQAHAFFQTDLAAEQVEPLDAVRALVDHVQAVVAPVLFHREIPGVAITAMDLDGERVRFEAVLAGPALDDRGEHLEQLAGFFCAECCARSLFVHQPCAIQAQRQGTFHIGLLRQQHALDVGVFDDSDLGLGGVLASRADGAALRPIAGIGKTRLVTGVAKHRRTQADPDTCLVHHVEHAAQAVARLADEVTNGARGAAHRKAVFAKVEQGVGRAAVAELVVEAGECHIVACPQPDALRVIDLHQPLGNDEQRHAAGARRQATVGSGDLGQHQVDDVFRDLVVPGRDPHLVARQAIPWPQRIGFKAVAVGQCPGRDVAQRGPHLRLTQAHGAEPAPAQLSLGEHLLLQGSAVHHQQTGVAPRQPHVGADRQAGFGERGRAGHLHGAGELHAADFVVLRRSNDAARGLRTHGVDRGLRQVHLVPVEGRLLQVGGAVGGGELLLGNPLACVQDRIEGLARVLGETRAAGQRFDADPVVQEEVDGGTEGHGCRCVNGADFSMETGRREVDHGCDEALNLARVPCRWSAPMGNRRPWCAASSGTSYRKVQILGASPNRQLLMARP